MVRFCPKCGHEVDATLFVCPNCSTKINPAKIMLLPSRAGIKKAETETQLLAAQNEILLQYQYLILDTQTRILKVVGSLSTAVGLLVALLLLTAFVSGCNAILRLPMP